MNSQKGFIQIPILVAIIIGVIVVGGVGYVGIQKFRGQKTELGQGILSRQTTLSNSEIINRIKPATVYVETEGGVGSGMLIDSDGYILTNAHVVSGVSAAKVKLSDGSLFSAEVTGRDEIMDLAVLKIAGNNLPKVTFGNSDNIVQGEDVFTLGYPFGLEGDVSFKEGTISRKVIDDDMTYLETSAEIHPGNSGGPLINKYGEVIGVNTAMLGQQIEGVTLGETIKLAIPINVAKSIITELKSGRNIVVEQKKPAQPSAPQQNLSRITAQIIEFEEVLEGKIVPADINCSVLASSNYILATSPSDSPNAWRDNQEATKEKCRSTFATLVLIRNKLVAEPETQNLRRILTAYIDYVRALAIYALDGGYSAQVVDKHSAEFDTFRLEAREELLRLQRKYNVKPQYIIQ